MTRWIGKILEGWASRYHVTLCHQLEKQNAELQAALTAERETTRQLTGVKEQNAKHVARITELEQSLAESEAALRVAQSENRLLSEIHEADIARRKRQRAIYDRDRALATAATNGEEESEG